MQKARFLPTRMDFPKNSSGGGVEYWNNGVLEFWSVGVLEYWKIGYYSALSDLPVSSLQSASCVGGRYVWFSLKKHQSGTYA
jgi:hypothetical protein